GNWFGLRAEPQAAERPGSVAGPAGYTPNRAMPECRRGQLHPFVRRIDLRCPLIRPLPAPTTPGSHQQTSFHIKNIRLVGPGLDADKEPARLVGAVPSRGVVARRLGLGIPRDEVTG